MAGTRARLQPQGQSFHETVKGRHGAAIGQGHDFLKRHSDSSDVPELRFLLARSHKAQGRARESLREVMLLMESQLATLSRPTPSPWLTGNNAGNHIANQLYQEGDYLSALQVYEGLAQLDRSPHWKLPACIRLAASTNASASPPTPSRASPKSSTARRSSTPPLRPR